MQRSVVVVVVASKDSDRRRSRAISGRRATSGQVFAPKSSLMDFQRVALALSTIWASTIRLHSSAAAAVAASALWSKIEKIQKK